jgi:hypothetical protein
LKFALPRPRYTQRTRRFRLGPTVNKISARWSNPKFPSNNQHIIPEPPAPISGLNSNDITETQIKFTNIIQNGLFYLTTKAFTISTPRSNFLIVVTM